MNFDSDKQNKFWWLVFYLKANERVIVDKTRKFFDSIIFQSFVLVRFDCCPIMSMCFFHAITNTTPSSKWNRREFFFLATFQYSVKISMLKLISTQYCHFSFSFLATCRGIRFIRYLFSFAYHSSLFTCKIFAKETKCCVLSAMVYMPQVNCWNVLISGFLWFHYEYMYLCKYVSLI